MHNWKALVRRRIEKLDVPPAEEQQIIAELASHLEDHYEQQLAAGCEEHEAAERALGELTEWRRLARGIRRAMHEEDEVNNRTRRFWLPGLVSLTAPNVLLMILQRAAYPLNVLKVGSVVMSLYVPLLLAAPLVGATGAYLSHRAGGDRAACVAAGLFPLTAMLATICVLALTGNFKLAAPLPVHFAIAMVFGVVLPGAALLLGVLPFLRAPKSMIPARN